MRLTSFSFRIFLLFSFVTTVIVLITGFLLSALYYVTTEKTIQTTLQNRANILIRDHISYDGDGLVYRLGEEGETITSRLRDFDASVVIYDKDITRIGTYGYYKNLVDDGKLADLAPDSLIKQVFETGKSVYNDTFIADQLFDVFTTPLLFNHVSVGVLQISVQNTLLYTLLSAGKIVLLFVLPLTIFLSWISVYAMTRYSFRPLKDLIDYMERATYSHLPPPVRPETMKLDELRSMFVSFNNMIQRLKDAIGKQQSYADHLSHELKTPLTRAVSTLDIATHHIENNEKSAAASSVSNTQQELLTLGRSIDTILQITGNTTHNQLNNKEDIVRVEHEIKTLLTQYHQIIKEKNITVASECPNSLVITFPIDHFRMIIGNLLSNAMKYTNRQGNVSISCIREHGVISISIANTGIPITPNTIPSLFLRYVRGAIHRFIAPGTGLGLPLVKDLCEIHALKLVVASTQQETRLTVRGFIETSPTQISHELLS